MLLVVINLYSCLHLSFIDPLIMLVHHPSSTSRIYVLFALLIDGLTCSRMWMLLWHSVRNHFSNFEHHLHHYWIGAASSFYHTDFFLSDDISCLAHIFVVSWPVLDSHRFENICCRCATSSCEARTNYARFLRGWLYSNVLFFQLQFKYDLLWLLSRLVVWGGLRSVVA